MIGPELALAIAAALLVALAILGWRHARVLAGLAAADRELAQAKAGLDQAREALAHERAQAERAVAGERARVDELGRLLLSARDEAGQLRADLATLTAQRDAERARADDELRQKDELLEVERAGLRKQEAQMREELQRRLGELNQKFASEFDALAARALKAANEEFMKRAEERFATTHAQAAGHLDQRRQAVEEMVRPIAETLQKTQAKLEDLQRGSLAQSSALREQLDMHAAAARALREETGRLVRALREPQVRGRYGEVQLRRVAELAGMRPYCDFVEQRGALDSDNALQRPDMVVRLPNGRELAVDAKANLKPYLDALEAPTPEAAEECLRAFANGIASQAAALSRKGYWSAYAGSPEFVVMFVPGDQFVDAALARRPDLLEVAAERGVILASPSTLIGLLHAVAVGYREQRLAATAAELRALGVEFHERAAVAMGYVANLGSTLNAAVDRYNEFVGSYQRRLEPTLRRFQECGASGSKAVPELKPITSQARGGLDGRAPTCDGAERTLPPAAGVTSDGQGTLLLGS